MTKVCSVAVLALLLVFARPWPREMDTALGTWLADRPHRWLFRVHADVLPRLAAAARGWGSPHGLGAAVGVPASFYAGSPLLSSGGLIQRSRGAGGGSVADLFIRAPRWLNGRTLLMPQRLRTAPAIARAGHLRISSTGAADGLSPRSCPLYVVHNVTMLSGAIFRPNFSRRGCTRPLCKRKWGIRCGPALRHRGDICDFDFLCSIPFGRWARPSSPWRCAKPISSPSTGRCTA